jgi:hypothetical protein
LRELEKLDKKKLTAFIAEYAKNDAKFANALNVRFNEPEFDKELDKIESNIDNALGDVSDYHNHDSWGHVYFNVNHM